MVTVDEYARIRQAHAHDKLSVRQLARNFGHSRRKIREILAQAEPKPYQRRAMPSILDPFKPVVDVIVGEDKQAPRKQRHTAAKIFRRLRDEHGYTGGYAPVHSIFGYDARPNVVARAENLPAKAWRKLERPPRYTVHTQPRPRPDNVKERIVVARQFENQRLQSEEVAEFNYQPTACTQTYRMVVVRKNISVEKGEKLLFDRIVYFFYLSNDWVAEANEIVFRANDRCDQENVLAQLLHAVRALTAPVDNLVSNWAYMVMTALAWNLKAWWALSLPETPGRWHERHRADKHWVLKIEFKTFVNAFVRIPCQLVRTGRKLLYRLLAWNPHQPIFFRLVSALRC